MMKRAVALIVVVAGIAVVSAQEGGQAPARGRGAGPQEQLVLSPKVKKLNDYVAPHKPHTKLADVLAKHKGQTDWVEPIVDDDNLRPLGQANQPFHSAQDLVAPVVREHDGPHARISTLDYPRHRDRLQ